jgi:hypothetical protein
MTKLLSNRAIAIFCLMCWFGGVGFQLGGVVLWLFLMVVMALGIMVFSVLIDHAISKHAVVEIEVPVKLIAYCKATFENINFRIVVPTVMIGVGAYLASGFPALLIVSGVELFVGLIFDEVLKRLRKS